MRLLVSSNAEYAAFLTPESACERRICKRGNTCPDTRPEEQVIHFFQKSNKLWIRMIPCVT